MRHNSTVRKGRRNLLTPSMPMAPASLALKTLPVSTSSFALPIPISRGRVHDDMLSLTIPLRVNGKPHLASSETTRMSQQRVKVSPQPTACPLMAQTIGFVQLIAARLESPPPSRKVIRLVLRLMGFFVFGASAEPPPATPSSPLLESCAPAQNAPPSGLPVTTTARTAIISSTPKRQFDTVNRSSNEAL